MWQGLDLPISDSRVMQLSPQVRVLWWRPLSLVWKYSSLPGHIPVVLLSWEQAPSRKENNSNRNITTLRFHAARAPYNVLPELTRPVPHHGNEQLDICYCKWNRCLILKISLCSLSTSSWPQLTRYISALLSFLSLSVNTCFHLWKPSGASLHLKLKGSPKPTCAVNVPLS